MLISAESPGSILTEMTALTGKPLRSFSREWKNLPQRIVEIPRAPARSTEGLIKIPAARFEFRVSGIMVEGGNDEGVDVQYPWEPSARRHHRQVLDLPAFYIMKYPVTNAEFKRFLDATKYRPADSHNFLRDWQNGAYPAGWDKKPVTWVSLEDARAYASWAGLRLPHEWEWQYACLLYTSRCV